MGEVDEVHQAQRHRQAHGQHEQQHPVGDAVEQQGQHRHLGAGSLTAVCLSNSML